MPSWWFVSLIVTLLWNCLSYGVHAASLTPGRCRNVSVVQNFEVERFQGQWYEVTRSTPILEVGGKCPRINYHLASNSVDLLATYTIIRDGQERRLSAKATPDDPGKKEGRYTAIVDVGTLYFFYNLQVPVPIWALDADLDKYALVYSCTEVGFFNTDDLIILSREPVLDQVYKDKINAVIERQGLSDKTLYDIEQSCGKY